MRVRLCQFRTGYVNQMFTNPYACTIRAICTVFCRAVKYRTYRTYRTWVSLRSIRLRLCCDKSQKLRVSNAFCLHRKAVWIFYSSVQLDSTIDLLKKDFNPRSPRGERPKQGQSGCRSWGFQSTLPARGATWLLTAPVYCRLISIHAPREGSDWYPTARPVFF